MIIGTDLDDTLAQTIEGFIQAHNKEYGTAHQVSDVSEYSLTKLWKVEREVARQRISKFVEEGLLKRLQPVPGAKSAIRKLAGFHDIVIITARPLSDEIYSKSWTNKYLRGMIKRIYHTDSIEDPQVKAKVCLAEGINVIVEDNPKTALACAEAGIHTVLLRRPWNLTTQSNGIYVASDWRDATEYLLKNVPVNH